MTKVVLIGYQESGKESFSKFLSGESKFKDRYIPTLGVTVNSSKCGKMNIWCCAGNPKFGGLREGYYIKSEIAIVFYDVNNKESYNKISEYIKSFESVCPNKKIFICGNKSDLGVKYNAKNNKSLDKYDQFIISVKNNDNCEEFRNTILKHIENTNNDMNENINSKDKEFEELENFFNELINLKNSSLEDNETKEEKDQFVEEYNSFKYLDMCQNFNIPKI